MACRVEEQSSAARARSRRPRLRRHAGNNLRERRWSGGLGCRYGRWMMNQQGTPDFIRTDGHVPWVRRFRYAFRALRV